MNTTTSPSSQPQGALTAEQISFEVLAALRTMVRKAQKQNWQDNYPSELEAACSAIAKADDAAKVAALAARPATAAAGVPSDEQIMDAVRHLAVDGGRWPSDWIAAARAGIALAAQTATQPASEALRRLSEIAASLGTPWPDDEADEESIRRIAWLTRECHALRNPKGKDDGYDPQADHDTMALAAFKAAGGTDFQAVRWAPEESRKWSAVVDAVLAAKRQGRPWNVSESTAFEGRLSRLADNWKSTPAQPAPAPGAGETQPLTMSMFANRKDFEAAGGKREDAK